MKNKLLIFFLFGVCSPCSAMEIPVAAYNDSLQIFFKKIDSIYVALYQQQQEKNKGAVEGSIAAIEELVTPIEENHPQVSGMVQLHQAYYAGSAAASKPYLQRALKNLREVSPESHLKYAGSFLWLIEGFYLEDRQEEWEAADSLFRTSLSKQGYTPRLAVGHTAYKALTEKNYHLVNILSRYDQYYYQQPANRVDKLYLSFLKWLQVKQKLEQWMEIPYSERSQTLYNFNPGQVVPAFLDQKDRSALTDFDYRTALKGLLKELEDLEPELISTPSSEDPEEVFRRDYFSLHEQIIKDLYLWGVNSHRQSEIILPMKKFLFGPVAEELKDATASGRTPLLTSTSIIGLFKDLAQLFYDVGNAEQAYEMIMRGGELIEASYSEDENLNAILTLTPLLIRTKRLSGDLESALDKAAVLKKVTQKPESLTSANRHLFESFAEARVEEIYTFMAQGRREQAMDSLSLLLEDLGSIEMENEDLLYETEAWPHFQYLTATVLAQKGDYRSSIVTEMVADLLRGRVTSEIFYPGQLFALKARWQETGELDRDYFQNLLLYTERQLQHNFVFLTAEERMQLYSHRLNAIFDVYHQLLFEGELEEFPELKQRVISQSLYLKNALADGNLIPDESFLKGNDFLDRKFLNEMRALKQETKLSQQLRKLHKIESDGDLLNDRIQTMWLELLEGGMDELVQLEGTEGIRQRLKPGEVYLESVRYTRALSDSTAVYGAYLLSAEEFTYLNICTEPALLELLEQKNSSPQTQSLTSSAERGGIGVSLSKKENFKPGDKDLLGQTLLAPLWPYLQGQSTLLMVHDGLLNRISFAALQWEQKYLMEHFRLRHFSGSEGIGSETTPPAAGSEALLAGGLDYGQEKHLNLERLFRPGIGWDFLPGTQAEIEMLKDLFTQAGFQPEMKVGQQLSDSMSRDLGKYSFVHLATHGFYFDSNAADQMFDPYLSRDALDLEPLFRSGLAISGANDPPAAKSLGTQGYLMGYELANMDLRNCYLISLSACETGLGDLRNNLGVDGLPRALKIAGARNLLISLWKVPDAPTAEFMRSFYSHLFQGKSPAMALQDTQRAMSSTYPASAWGAFILVE